MTRWLIDVEHIQVVSAAEWKLAPVRKTKNGRTFAKLLNGPLEFGDGGRRDWVLLVSDPTWEKIDRFCKAKAQQRVDAAKKAQATKIARYGPTGRRPKT